MNPTMQAVSREIRKILTERAMNFNIALDDVSITSLSFGKEFTHAIEAKQVAAQEAERAKFIVEKAEQDKKSAVIRAQVNNYPFLYNMWCTVLGNIVELTGDNNFIMEGATFTYFICDVNVCSFSFN
jgi:hypothetical protein